VKSARSKTIGILVAVSAAAVSPGCGATPSSDDAALGPDASALDAAELASDDASGPLSVALGVPPIGYLDEETCVDVTVLPASARVAIVWGDGERSEDVGARACHAYALPGTILVGAIAMDDGERAEATRTLLVVPRPSDPRPDVQQRRIAYDPGAIARVWVVNPDHGTVAVLSHDGHVRIDARARDRRVRRASHGERARRARAGGVSGRCTCGALSMPSIARADRRGGRATERQPTVRRGARSSGRASRSWHSRTWARWSVIDRRGRPRR
jgi:hypothetical protein